MKNRVWVLGELNADVIMRGNDVMPEFNKEKLVDSYDTVLGSSSAITACVLAGLGAQVSFVGLTGDDELGRFVTDKLSGHGVDTRFVQKHSTVGTGVTLSLSSPTDRALLTYMGTIPLLTPDYIPEEMYAEADHIHFGSYFLQEKMAGHWQAVFERAREAGITTSFDLGWDPSDRWDRSDWRKLLSVTDYFIPSKEEFLRLINAESLEAAVKLLPDDRGEVIVKCGKKGSLRIDLSGNFHHAPPFKVMPVDTTGAGDSFNAGFIHARLQGKNYEEAMIRGNASGALATLRVGGAETVPTVNELDEFIQEAING